MSLNWSVENVKDYETVCFTVAEEDIYNPIIIHVTHEDGSTEDKRDIDIRKGERMLRPMVDALIWASLGAQLGEIRADNLEEWAFRLELLRACGWSIFLSKPDEDGHRRHIAPTLLDLHPFVGLRVNVTSTTRTSFLHDVARRLERDAMSSIYSQRDELKLAGIELPKPTPKKRRKAYAHG